jgi:D-glycero-beta-D-manno-heptose 1-phosphate adenylyltransferase
MRQTEMIAAKIFDRHEMKRQVLRLRLQDKKIAFTNGCFDILHTGHIASLSSAAKEGDVLVVGVNSNASTRRLKGSDRPVNDERNRALLLASLVMVDYVVIFEEDTPLELITEIMPDAIVKGGDYTIDQIVGAKEVIANGGRVVINPIVEGFSTTGILEKIQKLG